MRRPPPPGSPSPRSDPSNSVTHYRGLWCIQLLCDREVMEIEKLIDTLKAKMEEARSDYNRILNLFTAGKAHESRLDYQKGVYDGLERAWREAVFTRQDMDRGQSA